MTFVSDCTQNCISQFCYRGNRMFLKEIERFVSYTDMVGRNALSSSKRVVRELVRLCAYMEVLS